MALMILSVAQSKCLCANKPKEAQSSPVSDFSSISLSDSSDLSWAFLYDNMKCVLINGVTLLKIKMTSKIGQMSHSLNTPIPLP